MSSISSGNSSGEIKIGVLDDDQIAVDAPGLAPSSASPLPAVRRLQRCFVIRMLLAANVRSRGDRGCPARSTSSHPTTMSSIRER